MARTANTDYPFSNVHSCRIHPGIGIARVGNSPDSFYIAADTPEGTRDAPAGGYKDANGRVRRQAALFRLYGYDKDGNNLGELPLRANGGEPAVEVEWSAHLVNKKGASHRFQDGLASNAPPRLRNSNGASHQYPDTRAPDERTELIIDPGKRTITASGASDNRQFDTGAFLGVPVYLGELQVDDGGRLLVLGGLGRAESTIPDNPIGADTRSTDYWANNDYWYDDISDGPVSAVVTLPDGRRIDISDPKDAAWVVVGPPNYAPSVDALVTLHDVAEEIAINAGWLSERAKAENERTQSLLSRMDNIGWVNNDARRGHRFSFAHCQPGAERARIFAVLRDPTAEGSAAIKQATARYMPPLYGDRGHGQAGVPASWFSLLPRQYRLLQKWKQVTAGEAADQPPQPPKDQTPDERVSELQRIVLDQAVGGPFAPGVEVGQLAKDPATYAGAFRIKRGPIKAGDLTSSLSLPWQAGLYLRREHWWPSARPDDVIPQDVFDEVNSLWLPGGKRVREGLEGRVKWDRGLGVSTLLRRPWQNPAATRDDPRDAARRAADDMVRYWHELGFVRRIRAASGEDVYVETERLPYAGMDIRYLFHALLNLENHRGCLGKAQEYVESVLQAARNVQKLPSAFNFMNNVRPFRYSEDVFEARMKDIYDDCMEFGLTQNGRPYNAANEEHNPYFATRENVIERIKQLTPFNFLDGAWLRNVHRMGPMDEVNSTLFSIFNEELGDGDVSQNHANVYRDLCHSFGFYPAPVASTAFAFDPQFLDAAFESATFQLGISEFPSLYYPEIIGMTLWLEWTALELHRAASILENVGLSSKFHRLHIAIDNAEDGHAGQILRAVKIYLHNVMLHGGEEAVQEQWSRIWDGYVAYALTFAILMQQIIHVLREPRSVEDQLLQLIGAKKLYGQYNHGTKKLGSVPINQFFNDPKAFLDGLIEHGYIVPGNPDASRFFKLLEFGGAMFRVFNDAEIKLWRDWVQDEAPSFKQRDRQRPKSLDERRLDEACRTKFNFVKQIADDRFGGLRQTASPRRVFLWLDAIDKAHRTGNGSATSPHNEADRARAVIKKYDNWLAWAMVRAVYHMVTQLRVTDRQPGQDALVRDLLDIRDASDFSVAAAHFLQSLKTKIAGSANGKVLSELEASPFGQLFDAIPPGGDGNTIRTLLSAWIGQGMPLPNVADKNPKALRLEATVEEEEFHPTGIALGYGAVH
ncbi:LodA/GoxA family CTQ-dependent oxidase [Bradyrhizobium sp. ORS 111]|uniref:LodA/GoxA family CTQ-dependent oxidase n=1 Tax=Bradyrhizobium sp. ORS 111 TaxID=1685958 RepID=UPI00388E167C